MLSRSSAVLVYVALACMLSLASAAHEEPPAAAAKVIGVWNSVSSEVCSAPCGRGFMSINVTCVSSTDATQVLPDTSCLTVKPRTSKKCLVKECVWSTVTDGKCSASCGPGHRQLKATCIEAGKPDVALPDKLCGGLRRPAALVKCNNRPCNWETKPTSPCSQPCGKGQQTVSNTCKDPVTGDVMPAKQCGADPPPSFQYCSVRSCAWDTTPFGGCSNSCGAGTQYFNVTCRDPPTGHRVDDAQCSLIRPPAPEAPCENNACGWRTRPIGECSAPCGKGIQKLSVTCEDPITGKLIDEKLCGANKPNSTAVCHIRECHWHRELKGKCSSPCGQGIQAYSLSCRDPENGKKQKKLQCQNIPVPSLSEPCFLHSCQWEAQNDGACDQICGPGRQKRTITCHDPVSKQRVDPELCTDKAPSKNTKCYKQACVWATVPISQCSSSCGLGTLSVNVTCTDPKKRFVLPDSQCFDASRPNTTQSCNIQACHWRTTPASACSNTCGKGTQKLNVICADPLTQKEQETEKCDVDTRPASNATCFVKPCTWVSDPPVSKCSEVCGPGHVQVNVTCQDAQAGRVYGDDQCAADAKPVGLQPCQIAECVWKPTWSECGVSCGGDFQYANLTCTHEDGTVVSNTQCKAAPPAWRQCATEACTSLKEAFLYYDFDDDLAGPGSKIVNRVTNAKSYGLDGAVQGAGTKSVVGRGGKGRAISFSSSGDHTTGPHIVIPPGLSLTSPSFSLSFWMQLLATPTKGRFYIIVDNRGTNGGGEGFVIYLDPRDGLLYLNDAYSAQLGKSHFADSGIAFPTDGLFHHVSVTYNQKLVRFFIDGKQTSVIDPSHAFKFTVSIATHKVYLRGSPDKYWRYLPMALDEFAYFDYPLDASQVGVLADFNSKNICSSHGRLTGGGCAGLVHKGDMLNGRCATAPYSIQECLQPLWGIAGCSTMGTSYPTAAGDAAIWNAQSWSQVKKTVESLVTRDVEPQLQAKKAWGACQNRTPSGLDHLCDHPPPYHTAVCLQGLFLELGCSRRATGFPASASHPLTRQLNELSWRDVKAKMQAIIKGDVKGGASEGVCHDPISDADK